MPSSNPLQLYRLQSIHYQYLVFTEICTLLQSIDSRNPENLLEMPFSTFVSSSEIVTMVPLYSNRTELPAHYQKEHYYILKRQKRERQKDAVVF